MAGRCAGSVRPGALPTCRSARCAIQSPRHGSSGSASCASRWLRAVPGLLGSGKAYLRRISFGGRVGSRLASGTERPTVVMTRKGASDPSRFGPERAAGGHSCQERGIGQLTRPGRSQFRGLDDLDSSAPGQTQRIHRRIPWLHTRPPWFLAQGGGGKKPELINGFRLRWKSHCIAQPAAGLISHARVVVPSIVAGLHRPARRFWVQ